MHAHAPAVATHADEYDPNVARRIAAGEAVSAADYIELGFARARVLEEVSTLFGPYDAMICPTVPCVAPTIAECEASIEEYARINMLCLRNPGVVNMMDGCAVSLPCQIEGELPIGLMVVGTAGSDRKILGVARAVEAALADAVGAEAAMPAKRSKM